MYVWVYVCVCECKGVCMCVYFFTFIISKEYTNKVRKKYQYIQYQNIHLNKRLNILILLEYIDINIANINLVWFLRLGELADG